MRLRWFIPIAILLPMQIYATDQPTTARVATITIDPREVTILHLRPEFESTIRMPEEVTSIILGSPGSFKAEHSEGEAEYVYVKPITKQPAQSNLLIATKSGQHVNLELVSDGAAKDNTQPIDFLINSDPPSPVPQKPVDTRHQPSAAYEQTLSSSVIPSALEQEFEQQERINAPKWTKWDGKQIETSIGDVRQWNNETVITYSIFNSSDEPVEIVPPQIQITGRKTEKKKKKEGKGIISDQLEIRNFKLSKTRIEAGGRADGVVVFDRPNFKESTEKLFLQIAQADQVDQPILIRLPFTPPIQGYEQQKGQ